MEQAWLLCYIVGVIMGIVASYLFIKLRGTDVSGWLVVDRSDPDDGPYLFLETKIDPAIIEQKEFVTFEVVSKNYISHE